MVHAGDGRPAAAPAGRSEDELHRELLAGLAGTVVEAGPGNGISFEHDPETVGEPIAVEPEPCFRDRAQERAATVAVDARAVDRTADELPLDDASADAVVVAGVLCSVADQLAALAEFRRVLRPGVRLRFCEHVRSLRPLPGRRRARVAAACSAAASPIARRWPRSRSPASPSSAAAASASRTTRAPTPPRRGSSAWRARPDAQDGRSPTGARRSINARMSSCTSHTLTFIPATTTPSLIQ